MDSKRSVFRVLFLTSFLGLFLLQGCVSLDSGATKSLAQTASSRFSAGPVACVQENQAVGEYFAVIEREKRERPDLVKALRNFPKGGDIHNHLSGAVMPEDYITLAIAERGCFGPASDGGKAYTIKAALADGGCPSDFKFVAEASATERQSLVQSLSMYGFSEKGAPSIQSGHDRFFATFGRFGAVSGSPCSTGPMLALLLRQAHADSVTYVETMVSFRQDEAGLLAGLLRQKYPDAASYREKTSYPAMFEYLLTVGLEDVVTAARKDVAASVNAGKAALRCGTREADPACEVAFDFQAQVSRNASLKDGSPDLAKIFTQIALNCLLADKESKVVGVNLVAPEDGSVSMESFSTQMEFFRFFHDRFPRVNIALHGGEITPCFVGASSPALKEHLTGSIRAGAKRVGHAVSFAYLGEGDRKEVAGLMKEKDVAVEVMFTSNAQILGVAGAEHPFTQYFRTYGIPTVFSTDDEGVSHGDFTNEWVYGVSRYGLTFRELTRLARTSLQHSFLPGDPLWRDLVSPEMADQCRGVSPGSRDPGEPCKSFLEKSPKAGMQWRHEEKLAAFEKQYGGILRKYLGN